MSENPAKRNNTLSKIKNISILGATGSVGVSTLDVINQHPNKFTVTALSTNQNIDLLYEQCIRFHPKFVVIADESLTNNFISKFNANEFQPEVLTGAYGLEKIASLNEVDYVMAAIVGAAGLPATLAAAKAGKRILLANKEALVMSGNILTKIIRQNNSQLLPIDSEHNAVFQCLPDEGVGSKVSKIILTASGGPFLKKPLNEFKQITPREACAHPNWEMGKKISVDSATMMNKGLELIEACKLFQMESLDIDIVIHPQSIIHSLVAYRDGSMLAHLAYPDMRVPIAHCLAWPERIESGVEIMDLVQVGKLEFARPDLKRFPCLKLAYDAINGAESSPTVLNAANEIAVDGFLKNRINFTEIPIVIEEVLQKLEPKKMNDLESIIETDLYARNYAEQFINQSLIKH